jgi:putative peptidoglycan lipid II flippase
MFPNFVQLKHRRLILAGYWSALFAATHLPQFHLDNEPVVGIQPDKAIHVVAFALLTYLLAAARVPAGRHARLAVVILAAIVTVVVYAPLDEWTQTFVGRTASLEDLLADLVGVALGGLACIAPRLRAASGPKGSASVPDTPSSSHAQSASRHFVSHAALVSALTFASRLTGLVRDAVLAAALGLSSVADAFFIGFLIPNLFRRLFGEGALSAAFIPHYTDLLRQDRKLAQRFASLVLALLTVTLGLITLLGEGVLLALQWSGRFHDDTLLALRYAMVMLPYMPLICLVAMIGGILQVHGRFGAPAAAPILLNLVMIVAAVTGGFVLDLNSMRHTATIVAWSVLVAGVVQLGWQLIAMWRCEQITLVFAGTGPALRGTLVMMGPMLVGLAVFQINAFLDSVIAFALAAKADGPQTFALFGHVIEYPIRQGAVAALQWSQRLYQFPQGVFGIAIATAIFPALAHAAADTSPAGQARLRTILQHGLRLTMFIGLPASVGLILTRVPLSRVIYERGQFELADAVRVAGILAGYSAAIWAYSMTHVLTRAFYAHKDAATPLRISMVMVAFNLVLNLTLIWSLGAAGLAWATAASATAQVVWLLAAIRKHIPHPVDAYVWRGWIATAALSAVMGLAIAPAVILYDPTAVSRSAAALQLAVMVVGGAAVFTVGALVLRVEELTWLRRRRG